MRVFAHRLVASIAAAVVVAAPTPAAAEGLPAPEEARVFIEVDRFFAQPRLLGDAWVQALSATLASMRRAVEIERRATRQLFAPAPSRQARVGAWEAVVPPLVRPTWPVVARPAPMLSEPITPPAVPVRGGQAVLLGFEVRLAADDEL